MIDRKGLFSFLLITSIQLASVSGQDTTSDPTSESAVTTEEAVEPPAIPAQITSLEVVQAIASADPNDQFKLLPRVSPRGVDAATQVAMVKSLVPLLQSEYPDIRSRAATAIGLFGKQSEFAIPELLKLLDDTELDARRKFVWAVASQALAQIGTGAIKPAMAMMPSAQGSEFVGITAIVSELGAHEEARAMAPFYIEHLKSGPPHHRWATMYCLSKLGDHARPAIPEYIRCLNDPNFNIQVIACRALAALGPLAKDAFPKLVELTKKKGNVLSTRTHAAMCLGAIGLVSEEIDLIMLLEDMISEPNAFCQERGLIALGRLGKDAGRSAEFIEGLFERDDFSQRPEAALALWKVTGKAERSVELLRPMISDLTFEFRALDAIKTIGPQAAPLADEVVRRLETDDASLQLMVIEVLHSIGEARQHVDRIRAIAEQAPPDIAIQIDKIVSELEGQSEGN